MMNKWLCESEPENYIRGSLANEVRWSGRGGVKRSTIFKKRSKLLNRNNENVGIAPRKSILPSNKYKSALNT